MQPKKKLKTEKESEVKEFWVLTRFYCYFAMEEVGRPASLSVIKV